MRFVIAYIVASCYSPGPLCPEHFHFWQALFPAGDLLFKPLHMLLPTHLLAHLRVSEEVCQQMYGQKHMQRFEHNVCMCEHQISSLTHLLLVCMCRVIQNLQYIHQQNPATHILVVGLLPRGFWQDPKDMFKLPNAFSRAISDVNRALRQHAFGNKRMHYADCTKPFMQTGNVSVSKQQHLHYSGFKSVY